jgi:hypothetical protein
MITLSDFANPPETPDSSARIETLQTGLSFEAALDYCLQNLKTHPTEHLWFWQRPEGHVVVRDVRN